MTREVIKELTIIKDTNEVTNKKSCCGQKKRKLTDQRQQC